MDRSIPFSNKIVFKRINEKNRQIHLAKLENIKSNISRETRSSFVQSKSINKKKTQLREDKLTEIERENRMLLDKLTNIMRSTSHGHGHGHVHPNAHAHVHAYEGGPKSLNRDLRKRELVKITIENQALLKRLQEQKPIYKRQAWDNDRRQQEVYLKNISEYPMNLTFLNNSAHASLEDRPRTFQVTRGNTAAIPNLVTLIDEKSTTSTTSRNADAIKRPQPVKNFKNDRLDPVNSKSKQKTMLYQTKKKIGFNNYLIQIYYHQDTFNIIASNNERADLKALSIPRKEGEELIARYKSYEDIVNKMKFKGAHILLEEEPSSPMASKKEENYTAPTEIAESQEENDVDYVEKKKTHPTQPNEIKTASDRKENGQKDASKPSTGKSKDNEIKVKEGGEIEEEQKSRSKPESGLSKSGEGNSRKMKTETPEVVDNNQEEVKNEEVRAEGNFTESIEEEYRQSLESGDFNSLKKSQE